MSRMGAILAEHDRGPEYAFVECIDCPEVAKIENSYGISDEALTKAFEALGWTIKPTRCPKHANPAPMTECPYTFSHTREWCGQDTCRES